MAQVGLLASQVGCNKDRLWSQGCIKAVPQAVGGISAEDDSPIAHLGGLERRGGCHAGLAYTALAGEENNPHNSLYQKAADPRPTGQGKKFVLEAAFVA